MKFFASILALLVLAAPHSHASAASQHGADKGKARITKATKGKGAKAKPAKGKLVKGKAAKAAPQPVAKAAVAASGIDYEGEQVNFADWQAVRVFVDEMAARHGFDRDELEARMRQVRFVDSAVQLVKPAPPGKPKNWQAYRERFIEPIRIGAGVRFWNENADALARAEATYGVPAEILAGIIGVETVYGRDTGRFRVLDTLTTLAFAYPEAPNAAARSAFFRSELENTLLLARHENIDPFSLLGSFAGAVGLPQFMPGNILKYGVDFDGDGHVDLRGSSADAIGSVANFLIQHGWNPREKGPAVIPADVAEHRHWESLLDRGLVASLRPDELAAVGVVTGTPLATDRLYGLVDLQNGAAPTEYWVASDNFFAITKYNRSYFYAMSVIELGRAVREARSGAVL
ncbi:lytic murein transglycosylase B [Massilia sp. Dwa41.01b]|uniref:lytic murein transglycosylase B n=1 Tax=unclassified Massilia TaxID=2609279 RepID=UPI0016019827|nr:MULTISPECIES: lytic murein transglycosylase B [unclassified Massilia]QNA88391.1 lytic murein transglycosylase B [Massilia sp. Dwa41.01b]QNA99289.1 lytic murein transglycosylase B [Massilia sp. Se16.2.3]